MGKNTNIKNENIFIALIKKTLFINVALHLIFAWVAWFYGGMDSLNYYLTPMVVSIALSEVLIVYGRMQGADKSVVGAIIGLNILGILIQSVFGEENSADRHKLCIFILLAIVVAVIYAIVTRKFTFSAKWLTIGSGGIALICLAVCCFLPAVNGARNWIPLGFMSVQVTEIIKFFAVVFLGLLYICKGSCVKKFWVSTVFTAVCAALLMLRINEMGTLLVIGLVYLCMTFMYNTNKKCKLFLVVFLIFGVGVFAFGYTHIDSISYKWECPSGCHVMVKDKDGNEIDTGKLKVLQDSIVCDSCNSGKFYEEATFECGKCHYRKYTELPKLEEGEVYPCDNCSKDPLLGSPFGSKLSKLYSRFSVWLSYDKLKYENSAFQMRQGKDLGIMGGWFGIRDCDAYITNMRNDSVIAGTLSYMGYAFVALILLLYYIVFLGIRHARSPLKAAAYLAVCLQTMLAVMGNFNLFALTGIGVPLISSGGTVCIVSYLLIYTMLTADGRKAGGE